MAVKIVVDSSSDIPKNLASQLKIMIVPMQVSIDEQSYFEGVDIFPEQFYANFKNYKTLPKTSQPNPDWLKENYEKVLQEGHEIIAIHLSSGLSSTYETAVSVAGTCSSPEKIHIIDSLGASLGFGLQAILAAGMLERENNLDNILKQVIDIRDRMRYIFTLDTMEYLVKGGRASKTAGFVAGMLDVKPILHINREGKIEVFGKVRSRKAAIRRLVEIMEKEIAEPENQIVGISHSACYAEAEFLATEIRARLQIKDIVISDIGCVIGSHVGPGTLALFYLAGGPRS